MKTNHSVSRKLALDKYLPHVGSVAYGCMGLSRASADRSDLVIANQAIDVALECGVRLFDHADIYGRGKAEAVFGKVLAERPQLLDKLYLQSKCSIRFENDLAPKRYDFSASWVTASVEGSLARLQVECLDILMLHRPDPLLELDELAEALIALRDSGKVKFFGVSNMHSYQIRQLQSAIDAPIVANQMEMSLAQRDWLEEGILAGQASGAGRHFSPGLLEYCQENDIQLQSWGSLAQGIYSGANTSNKDSIVSNTSLLVSKLAELHNTSAEAIVLAWLLRHPVGIQTVIGTTNTDRIRACCAARDVELTREQWYALWVEACGEELP